MTQFSLWQWRCFFDAAGIPAREAETYPYGFTCRQVTLEDLTGNNLDRELKHDMDPDDWNKIVSHIIRVQVLHGTQANPSKYLQSTIPETSANLSDDELKELELKMLADQKELMKTYKNTPIPPETWVEFVKAAGVPERQAQQYAEIFSEKQFTIGGFFDGIFYNIVSKYWMIFDDRDVQAIEKHAQHVNDLIAQEEATDEQDVQMNSQEYTSCATQPSNWQPGKRDLASFSGDNADKESSEPMVVKKTKIF
ncbi:hypothetical protein DMENIID0001_060600 [Sergentomyia squamirostris]